MALMFRQANITHTMINLRAISQKFPGRLSKVDLWAYTLIAGSLVLCLGWVFYTGYIEEDAFITFRFARQIAAGNGFVYNNGERIYGTTTPLLTLLLSGWLKLFSTDIVTGARILNICAYIGTFFFTWRTLRTLQRPAAEQLFVLTALLSSMKLLHLSMQGMEMPLVTFLMSASWYACTKGNWKWTGFLCGLLLWTRIDLLFWPAALIIVLGLHSRKNAATVAAFTALTYLPWVMFANEYFGSPIPYTVTAKWVAYNYQNHSSYLSHLVKILKYLTPFYKTGDDFFLGQSITLGIFAWTVWRGQITREANILVILVFIIVEVGRLTLTRETIFNRYFMPLLWASLVFVGIGLGMLWGRLKNVRIFNHLFLVFLALTLFAVIGSGLSFAKSANMYQKNRFENSLAAIGLWLYQNSAPQSTVLLEPLGYVGYYSERHMIDEVGLVTPEVVKLKLQEVPSDLYTAFFHPDYVIQHCDDALRMLSTQETRLAEEYVLAREYNPLAFDPATPGQPPDPDGLRRSSCYQIWQKQTLAFSKGKP